MQSSEISPPGEMRDRALIFFFFLFRLHCVLSSILSTGNAISEVTVGQCFRFTFIVLDLPPGTQTPSSFVL